MALTLGGRVAAAVPAALPAALPVAVAAAVAAAEETPVRRDPRAVDEAGPRLGVRERDDDDELVGVRDDDPLDRVGVLGGPRERRAALADLDDARQAPLGSRRVPDQP